MDTRGFGISCPSVIPAVPGAGQPVPAQWASHCCAKCHHDNKRLLKITDHFSASGSLLGNKEMVGLHKGRAHATQDVFHAVSVAPLSNGLTGSHQNRPERVTTIFRPFVYFPVSSADEGGRTQMLTNSPTRTPRGKRPRVSWGDKSATPPTGWERSAHRQRGSWGTSPADGSLCPGISV